MDSYFLFIFTTMLAKFFKRPFTLVSGEGARKMACCRKGKTVRYFHGLVKYCIRPRIRVFYESIIVIETRRAVDVKTIVYAKFRGWYQSG